MTEFYAFKMILIPHFKSWGNMHFGLQRPEFIHFGLHKIEMVCKKNLHRFSLQLGEVLRIGL